MSNIATTIQQSKKLIAAGLNPDTADMVYTSLFYESIKDKQYYILEVRNVVEDFNDDEIPAWSLSSLIEISNDCGWTGDKFEVGNCTADYVIEGFVNFIHNMLNDDGEYDDTGSILDWQEKYKINKDE